MKEYNVVYASTSVDLEIKLNHLAKVGYELKTHQYCTGGSHVAIMEREKETPWTPGDGL